MSRWTVEEPALKDLGRCQNDLLAAIERLTLHAHLCLIYETKEEQFAALVPFVRIGLEREEQCIYVVDESTASEVLDAMRSGGVDIESAIESGAFVVATKRDAYLKAGYFDPDLMIDFLKNSTIAAKAAGYSGLRVTGEMTWTLGHEPGVDRLIEYEAKLNYFFPEYDALAICQYNRNRFSPEIIVDVIRTHPLVVFGGTVCRNFYYVPPDEFLQPEQASREVDRLLTNVLDRERAEQALRSANRVLRMLSGVNQVLVRATDESTLLDDTCRVIVEIGGYRMAWIALAEHDIEKTVRPVAHAGYEEGYLDAVRITWADTEQGRGPTGTAIRTGKPSFVYDISTDPAYAPWRAEALKRGYASSVSVPLIAGGQIVGGLTLYSEQPDPFVGQEVDLLTELAADLGYGITTLREQEEHRRAEEEKRALEQHLEEQKRKFYRETILSVTENKLDICEPADVAPYLASAQETVDISEMSDVGAARRKAESACRTFGLDEARLREFVNGIGEAITNVLKHGIRGRLYAGRMENEVWVGVADIGPGIESLILPRAVLRRGFSTKPSLGLGYSIMLEVADHILLTTGDSGTTVILIKYLMKPATTPMDALPDTWRGIA